MERNATIKMKPMKIHDKWYDMSDFKHPGGPIMLKLGESRDATALFESHHPFTPRKYLETLLAKHEVKSVDDKCYMLDPRDKEEVFDWPEFEAKSEDDVQAPVSEFAYELRTKVHDYFKAEAKRRGVSLIEATKAPPMRWASLALMALSFIITLPAFMRGELWTLFWTPFTYWIMGVNTFHDCSHFALSRDWRVNMLGTYTGWWFSSPFEWYHQHVIGHHAYPNIPHRDPDLYHNGTFERHTKTLRHRPLHKHQASTWPPIWFIGTFAMNYLKPMQMLMTGWYNRAVAMVQYPKERIYQHVIGRIAWFSLLYFWPFFFMTPMRAFMFAVVPVGAVSVFFMICSQVNHLTSENIDVEDKDFYKHQVITGHSFGDHNTLSGWMNFYFTGGLNLQIEHHLFPTVNRIHLPYLQPIVKAVCKKHDVFYHESNGIVEALGKYHKHMVELSTP